MRTSLPLPRYAVPQLCPDVRCRLCRAACAMLPVLCCLCDAPCAYVQPACALLPAMSPELCGMSLCGVLCALCLGYTGDFAG